MSNPTAEHIPDEDFVEYRAFRNQIREKILHTLSIWPRLSPSMLQVGIGTGIKPQMWHPILDALVAEGVVVRKELSARSHIGRDQVYSIIMLADESAVKN